MSIAKNQTKHLGLSLIKSAYFQVFVFAAIAIIIALVTYKDYGMCWDEPDQRVWGLQSYEYIFNGKQDLLNGGSDNHGVGFEILLMIIEKNLGLTDSADIFMMRHLATHLFFILSAAALYLLIYRLFKNKFLAFSGFVMLVIMPRIYAHSYFNSKDAPFLSMIVFILLLMQVAFEKKKPVYFALLGIACGYATSIRLMAVMLFCIICAMILWDLFTIKGRFKNGVFCFLLFIVFAAFSLYIAWPLLWQTPVHTFIVAFQALSHYNWIGEVFMGGRHYGTNAMPMVYFPTWFTITTPSLWFILGCTGIIAILFDFLRDPLVFFRNTMQRNFLVYMICFFAPVFIVIFFHSVIYDDWRHLYFVYPFFLLMGIYFVNKVMHTKLDVLLKLWILSQVWSTGRFMFTDHPFQEVYFNRFVSHEPDFLRKNYDLDYWGCSFKQGLEHLIAEHPAGKIKISCGGNAVPLLNNILMLPEKDRTRIEYVEADQADYVLTIFRDHPDDFPYANIDYTITVLNSPIMRVYKTK